MTGPDAPPSAALDAAGVRRQAAAAAGLGELHDRVVECRACPRLVSWRESVAANRRRAFADQEYWGRPVPGWGAEQPRMLLVGLAPAAHGGNRTGRVFTGDPSGDVLFAALHRTGWAAQPYSRALDDGQRLDQARVIAAVRCAPPDNKPTNEERDTCQPWMVREMALCLPSTRVVVTLGAFAWRQTLAALAVLGFAMPRPRPAFGHTVEIALPRPQAPAPPLLLLGSYHPSQRNVQTGLLRPDMLDAVFVRAHELAYGPD